MMQTSRKIGRGVKFPACIDRLLNQFDPMRGIAPTAGAHILDAIVL